MNKKKNTIMLPALIGAVLVAVILIVGTIIMGRAANEDTKKAVNSVSLLYLDELAGRREEVVANTLSNNIEKMYVAIGLMDEEDLSDMKHLQAYQARMKKLYDLEKFAFVDSNGLIYTSLGTQTDIDEYQFDYNRLVEPEISIKNIDSDEKKVIIAVPVDDIPFNGETLVVCFMEINMDSMLEGVSLKSDNNSTTFVNIYTRDGVALTNMILGGLASEDNLLQAMGNADYKSEYSYDKFLEDFKNGNKGVVSFTYNGTEETLSYVPIDGTDWMLTYLIRESVITDEISSVSKSIITRSLIQSILTALVLFAMFALIIMQTRKNAALAIEKETSEAESKIKHEELERRLELQEQLLEQEKRRAQQDSMITALATDYRSVYYVNLDLNEGICYRQDAELSDHLKVGDTFNFEDTFKKYAEVHVCESYRDGFLEFIKPDNIRRSLEKDVIIAHRYLAIRDGKEVYEMLRMAGVRSKEDRDDNKIHAVGVGFTDIDTEMRESLAKNEALSDALAVVEEANRAKTAFLSNMSHEIRTPMNAIIGLDNIALNDEDISDKTRDHLEKIGASAQHLLGIINDILDMSRIESGRMTIKNEEFSFSKMLENINTLFIGQCDEKELNYNCHINGSVDDYYIGDSTKLRQVLVNILSNSVKFTPKGGNVTLSVERTAHYENNSTLRFMIEDTGIGMSEEFLPKLFDTFTQEGNSASNKYGSSGLGMAITKNIVEMMNGNIEVKSTKGEGTVFTVTVTLMDSDRQILGSEDIEIKPQEMSVLIIDDDPVAAENGKLVLENVGIASEIALSGKDAIEMVTIRHARRNPYNLILVDWKMPGMDGVETTRKIRSIVGTESAIIILTAYNWDDVIEEAMKAGVDSFLAKPIFASNVLDGFRYALEKKTKVADEEVHKADLTGRRILLAEDMEVNAEIMGMVLQMREMEVEYAENGRIALEKFESNPVGYYDAILMDMRMPEMDGLEATVKIRATGKEDARTIPIIALTANAFDEDVQRSLQAGLNAHLSKPVEPDVLFETLESLIK